MTQKDITALATIFGSANVSSTIIESLISYLKSDYEELNFKELSILTQVKPDPMPTPLILKNEQNNTVLEVVSKPEPPKTHELEHPMTIIPKVLCRLREEMGYGISPEDD